MLSIQDIRRNPDGIHFEKNFDLLSELQERNSDILDLRDVQAQGQVRYEDGLYFLDYQLSYTITLASSRSLRPVEMEEDYAVNELFVTQDDSSNQEDLIEQAMVLVIEGDDIDLKESVADNILLSIPVRVLTPDEEESDELPTGQDWTVLTEEAYQLEQEKKKEANNPFASLQGLFEED